MSIEQAKYALKYNSVYSLYENTLRSIGQYTRYINRNATKGRIITAIGQKRSRQEKRSLKGRYINPDLRREQLLSSSNNSIRDKIRRGENPATEKVAVAALYNISKSGIYIFKC